MFYHLKYVFGGLLVSLIGFLLNLSYWREHGLLKGLLSSLAFGFVIALTIWSVFASVFAALTAIHIQTGWPLRVPRYALFVIGAFGMTCGLWIVLRVRGEGVGNWNFFSAKVFGGSVLIVFYLHLAYRQAKEDALALQATAAEARYQTLENQMRPHFLFNALNSLAELIESGHPRAADMTHTLAELYRSILLNSQKKTVPLAAEMEIVLRYLELEKLRFAARLEYSITAPEEAKEVYVPSLMAQTLVENAVKHGIAKAIAGGSIHIEVAAQNGRYRLAVTNSGQPFTDAEATGTGLANTRARLDLLYPDRHEFGIATDTNGKTVASFYFSGEPLD